MARAPNIEKLLKALSNIYEENALLGLLSETRVLKYYLERGYKLLEHRYKGIYAEIDLIVEKQKRRILIEVKTLSHESHKNYRITKSQKARLSREFLNQINKYPNYEMEFHYVVVSQYGKIEVYDDYFGM